MKHAYPELGESTQRTSEVIRKEEEAFGQTIHAALARMDSMFSRMDQEGRVMVDGAEAADLYKTFGVPPELLQTMAAERNLTFDWDGYADAMDQHAIDSGAGQKELFQTGPLETLKEAFRETEFIGYETTEGKAVVKGIIIGAEDAEERLVSQVAAGGANQTLRICSRSLSVLWRKRWAGWGYWKNFVVKDSNLKYSIHSDMVT